MHDVLSDEVLQLGAAIDSIESRERAQSTVLEDASASTRSLRERLVAAEAADAGLRDEIRRHTTTDIIQQCCCCPAVDNDKPESVSFAPSVRDINELNNQKLRHMEDIEEFYRRAVRAEEESLRRKKLFAAELAALHDQAARAQQQSEAIDIQLRRVEALRTATKEVASKALLELQICFSDMNKEVE